MYTHYKLCLILGLFFIFNNLSAQQSNFKITGIIQDNKNHPIDYTEVFVTDSSNSIIQRTLTDSIGKFSFILRAGSYKLNSRRFETVILEKDLKVNNDIDLGIISVTNSDFKLEEVVISGQRKLIERKVDRLVYNIANSPLLSDGNVYDAVKSAPGIYVGNNESINIMGKAGVKVMIDDRMLYLSSDELINYLKSMRADNIKSLEIITNPSSKYDADGNAGIINIVTKKGREKGWNANLGLTGYQGKYSRLIGSTGINFKTNRLDFTSGYTIGDVRSFEEIKQKNDLVNTGGTTKYNSYNYENRKEVFHSFRGQLDIKLNKSSNLGISGSIFSDRSPRPSTNETTSSNKTSFISLNDHKLNLSNYSADIYFNQKLDTIGKAMSIGISTANFKTNNDQDLKNHFYVNGTFNNTQRLRSFFENSTKIYAGNIDFKLPYKTFTLETGAKYSKTTTDNDFLFQNYQAGQWQNNTSLSNQFDYTETNTSGYFSINGKFSNAWSFQAGLRGEYTRTQGLSLTTGTETDYNYFELFPTAYLQYKPEKRDHSFNLSYSRRINRPTYDYLNPFISYQSPLFSNRGNPLLRPSFTNSIEISSTLKNRYILTLFGNNTSKFFSEFPLRVNNTDETRYTFDNIGSSFNIGLQTVIPIQIAKWWSISNTFLVMAQNYDLSYKDISQNLSNFFWLANTSNTFTIKKNISTELTGRYRSSSIQGFYRIGNYFDMSVAINIKLLNDKATLSFSASDLLYTNRAIVNIQYPNQDLGFTRYNDTRLIKLSFKYNFGNTGLKNKNQQKSVSTEEQSRAEK
ncbi:TonB-dependent receptor [Elizabethkingia anophelis]|nr:TonB-dependent receptor [Elizabethkingia anophelis]MCT3994398.1 TonB-dependent receptor [Elizabethkingia anophelis]MCT3997888.1 TonB-dependent receptor [Elizabethkingia anophelis]MCT4254933.1 TonB-dependent receptor [Elizabethkingia anophelis]